MTGTVIDREEKYTIRDELASSFVSEYMNGYAGFIESVKRGLEDYRQGKLIPWAKVKKELGYV
jgi:hypothetical protein